MASPPVNKFSPWRRIKSVSWGSAKVPWLSVQAQFQCGSAGISASLDIVSSNCPKIPPGNVGSMPTANPYRYGVLDGVEFNPATLPGNLWSPGVVEGNTAQQDWHYSVRRFGATPPVNKTPPPGVNSVPRGLVYLALPAGTQYDRLIDDSYGQAYLMIQLPAAFEALPPEEKALPDPKLRIVVQGGGGAGTDMSLHTTAYADFYGTMYLKDRDTSGDLTVAYGSFEHGTLIEGGAVAMGYSESLFMLENFLGFKNVEAGDAESVTWTIEFYYATKRLFVNGVLAPRP